MSKYSTTSMFPQQVDPPIFFSDIRLEQEVALTTYKELIEEKKYDEASVYLEEHTEVDAYCADLFNMLVNRTKAVQRYANGDYIPPVNSNPIVMINSLPDDASEYDGKNVLCVSADDLSGGSFGRFDPSRLEEVDNNRYQTYILIKFNKPEGSASSTRDIIYSCAIKKDSGVWSQLKSGEICLLRNKDNNRVGEIEDLDVLISWNYDYAIYARELLQNNNLIIPDEYGVILCDFRNYGSEAEEDEVAYLCVGY